MLLRIVILAIIQGLAELLPISSSAHVIVAEKLMGLDPSTPEMTLLLVMLHTGTMFAVIFYFWNSWKETFFSSAAVFKRQAIRLVLATALTGVIGGPLLVGIPRIASRLGYVSRDAAGHLNKVEVESLFKNLELIAAALGAAGVLIIIAGLSKRSRGQGEVGLREAGWMGILQGLCLPFRGFSRSGATISAGLFLGSAKARVEEFSFAMAVIITPAAIVWEARRLFEHSNESGAGDAGRATLAALFGPGLVGMVLSFLAGLLALKLLSRVLEKGRWHFFGFYCLAAAAVIFGLYLKGR